MKEFLNKNLVSLLVLAGLVVIYLQRCGGNEAQLPPTEKHDTVVMEFHHYHDTVIYSKSTQINHIPATEDDVPTVMVPDSTYAGLRRQYDSLSSEYYARNVFVDSVKVDSIGIVKTTDTTQANRLLGRKWEYHFDIKERLTTITHTIYPAPKRQVYIGGGILGNEQQLVMGGKAGLFYKDRRDRVFGAEVIKIDGQPIIYSLTNYWKIRFGKKSP